MYVFNTTKYWLDILIKYPVIESQRHQLLLVTTTILKANSVRTENTINEAKDLKALLYWTQIRL